MEFKCEVKRIIKRINICNRLLYLMCILTAVSIFLSGYFYRSLGIISSLVSFTVFTICNLFCAHVIKANKDYKYILEAELDELDGKEIEE